MLELDSTKGVTELSDTDCYANFWKIDAEDEITMSEKLLALGMTDQFDVEPVSIHDLFVNAQNIFGDDEANCQPIVSLDEIEQIFAIFDNDEKLFQ